MKAPSPQARQAESTVDISVEGKQHGHLSVPCPSTRSALGTVQIPVCVIKNGDGPIITLLAGAHGDEYDGQIALHNLSRSIQADDINGCLIMVPTMNPCAADTHSRVSSVDGKDLDSCFPGNTSGSVSEQMAAHIFETLVAPADLTIELQSGGTTTLYTSLAAVHFDTDNADLQIRSEQHMIAFGAPYSARLLPSQIGSLAHSVQRLQKEFVAVRLGGGSCAYVNNVEIAQTGCCNILIQAGVLKRELTLRATRMLELTTEKNYLTAPCSGLLAMYKEVGDEIYTGSPIANIMQPGNTGAAAITLKANRNGILMARHYSGYISHGDCVAIVADEVQR